MDDLEGIYMGEYVLMISCLLSVAARKLVNEKIFDNVTDSA